MILADFSMPEFDSLRALEILQEHLGYCEILLVKLPPAIRPANRWSRFVERANAPPLLPGSFSLSAASRSCPRSCSTSILFPIR
jgi:hypothetical protein